MQKSYLKVRNGPLSKMWLKNIETFSTIQNLLSIWKVSWMLKVPHGATNSYFETVICNGSW